MIESKSKSVTETIPNFCWDRKLTEKQIQQELQALTGLQKTLFLSWILREAAFRDVWKYVTPQEIWSQFPQLKQFLGRRRDFWGFILGKWHELGKI
jgi:hypothetical protein